MLFRSESFFGHFKDECPYSECKDIEELRELVARYAEYYNYERRMWDKGLSLIHIFTYPLNRAERDVLRGEMEACYQRRTGRTLAQHYNHLLVQEEVEPPELTAGTRRIPVDKVRFADELSECGGLLQFYMPVAFAPDAVFGTHVEIGRAHV